ncbi:hypothetical protein ACROYT_G030694 [Oculina patagonica]
MKVLPLHFREKSAEFYGKRGINWHVTAVIRKTQECSLSVDVFVHVYDSCDQNQITVASITQNTLFTLKELYPELTGVYLRSDNAGCYHGGYLLTSLPSIGHETGIRVIGYDFSEAQHGKDICDRKTATMKQHARRFVAETKTDILTVRDLKKALESNGGVKGCRVSVAEMPQRSSQIDVKKRENKRNYGADMINDELSKPLFAAYFSCESEQSGQGVNNITMGWALKTHKSSRFSETVKAYLNDRFLIGEETGNKASPTQVAREMRRERDVKGNRLFVGSDCLSSQQIASYFSRLATAKKKHGSLNAAASLEEVEEFLDEEQMQE